MDKALKNNSIVGLVILAVISFVGLFFFKAESYYKMAGILMIMPLAFYLENKLIKFEAKTKWWKQILKIIIGFVVVLGFKEGLKLVFPEGLIFELLRYLTVGFVALYLVPQIFVSTKLAKRMQKESMEQNV